MCGGGGVFETCIYELGIHKSKMKKISGNAGLGPPHLSTAVYEESQTFASERGLPGCPESILTNMGGQIILAFLAWNA